MSDFPISLPIDGFFAPLFEDFVTRRDGTLAGILGRFDAGSPMWPRRLEAAAGETPGRRRFFDDLARYNHDLGVGERVVARLGEVASGAARTVLTGQQPGVLGGPLMTLYKIETAIALAGRLEEEHGVPCVPVYWMGADDTDFAEIRELVILNAELKALATSLPGGAHEVAMPVGDIDADWLRRIWDGIDAFVGGFEGGATVVDAVSSALEAGEDHAGVTARVVTALTGGEIAVVDARDGRLREAAAGTILSYFDREDEIRRSVEAAGRALEEGGFHSQLSLGPDSGVFLLENGRRTKIPAERREEARGRIAEDPARAWPGVVVRNLVQDVVFDPLAVILGPAEVAYRAQIRGVYDLCGVPMPVTFPRLFATYVPGDVAGTIAETGVDAALLVRAPQEFVHAVYASRADDALEEQRRRFEETFAAGRERFVSVARERMSESDVSRMDKRLADVSRRLSQAVSAVAEVGRRRALERWPFLDGLTDVFRRRDDIQERYLSMLTPFLFGGCTKDDCVRRVARRHVDGAMDGRIDHVVYSD